MADTVASTNMSLPVPVVGVDPGPNYASDLNSCLIIIDGHDHTAGLGVPITPSGLNINSNLPFNNSNAITLRSVRFQPQATAINAVTDIGCLYEVVNDLYYNDGSGNQVRITQSGAVAGSPGSISNLVSPATASYSAVASTFTFQSGVNIAASLDGRNVVLRNSSASSFGLTLSPPAAMGANFTLTLPSLPASTKIMSLDASGNVGASYGVDNSTLEISSNTIQVKDAGITRPKLAALGQQLSSSSGLFSTAATAVTDVTNLSVTITTTGRPVFLALIAEQGVQGAHVRVTAGTSQAFGYIIFIRGASLISEQLYGGSVTGGTLVDYRMPVSMVQTIDPVAAGTYTYKCAVANSTSGQTMVVAYTKLIAYEIG